MIVCGDNKVMTSHLIVVGAGLAGLSAAYRGLELGLRVTVLERATEEPHPCASRANSGIFHAAFRSLKVDPDDLLKAIRTANDGFGRPDVAHALAYNAKRGVDWLQSLGVEFAPAEQDADWKDLKLAPSGFSDKPDLAWQGLGADRMLTTLERQAIKSGARIDRGARVHELLFEAGRVCGVRTTMGSGEDIVRGDAVVLTDGGFEGNRELVRRHITAHPEHLMMRGLSSGLGDGILMAEAAGAQLVGMQSFYGHLLSADSLNQDGLSPFPFLDFLASAGMLVDQTGKRFMDESLGGVRMANGLAAHDNGLGWVVFDHAMWEGIGRHFFRPPNPNLVNAGGTLHRCETLESLAGLLAVPHRHLQDGIRAVNAEAATNANVASANPTSPGPSQHHRFEHAPYYAAPVCAGLTSTLGGIEIDASGHVLDHSGQFIPGLYAAGNSTGGVEGGPSVGYVGGLIKALVFGLLCAEEIARSSSPRSR